MQAELEEVDDKVTEKKIKMQNIERYAQCTGKEGGGVVVLTVAVVDYRVGSTSPPYLFILGFFLFLCLRSLFLLSPSLPPPPLSIFPQWFRWSIGRIERSAEDVGRLEAERAKLPRAD